MQMSNDIENFQIGTKCISYFYTSDKVFYQFLNILFNFIVIVTRFITKTKKNY